jgi:hypothetical protein
MIRLTYTILWIALLGTSLRADVVVDFETAPPGVYSVGEGFNTQGFTFTEDLNSPSATAAFAMVPTNCSPSCVSDGTQTLGAFNASLINMKLAAGGTFDLLALDFAGTFPGSTRNTSVLEVDGHLLGGGVVTALLTTPDPNTFATFALPITFGDLVSVDIYGIQDAGNGGPNGPEFQLDNLVTSTFTSVPEPAMTFPIIFVVGIIFFSTRKILRLQQGHQSSEVENGRSESTANRSV